MTNSETAIIRELKDALVNFIEALIEILPRESELPIAHTYLVTQANFEQAMYHIIKRLVPHEAQIRECIENPAESMNAPFINDGSIYGGALTKAATITHYKEIWVSTNILTDQNRRAILRWSLFLIRIAKKLMILKGITSPDQIS